MPGLISTWLLVAIFSVKDLIIPLMLFAARSKLLSVALWEYSQGNNVEESMALIMGILEMGIIVVFWVTARFASRRFGGELKTGF